MQIFANANYDFLRWRWVALAVSWIIILAGVGVIMTRGIPRGVEFSGGTVVITKFEQAVSVEQVRAALEKAFPGVESVVQEYGNPGDHLMMVRVPLVGEE